MERILTAAQDDDDRTQAHAFAEVRHPRPCAGQDGPRRGRSRARLGLLMMHPAIVEAEKNSSPWVLSAYNGGLHAALSAQKPTGPRLPPPSRLSPPPLHALPGPRRPACTPWAPTTSARVAKSSPCLPCLACLASPRLQACLYALGAYNKCLGDAITRAEDVEEDAAAERRQAAAEFDQVFEEKSTYMRRASAAEVGGLFLRWRWWCEARGGGGGGGDEGMAAVGDVEFLSPRLGPLLLRRPSP